MFLSCFSFYHLVLVLLFGLSSHSLCSCLLMLLSCFSTLISLLRPTLWLLDSHLTSPILILLLILSSHFSDSHPLRASWLWDTVHIVRSDMQLLWVITWMVQSNCVKSIWWHLKSGWCCSWRDRQLTLGHRTGGSSAPLQLGRFEGTLPLSVSWIFSKASVKCCNSVLISFDIWSSPWRWERIW